MIHRLGWAYKFPFGYVRSIGFRPLRVPRSLENACSQVVEAEHQMPGLAAVVVKPKDELGECREGNLEPSHLDQCRPSLPLKSVGALTERQQKELGCRPVTV